MEIFNSIWTALSTPNEGLLNRLYVNSWGGKL